MCMDGRIRNMSKLSFCLPSAKRVEAGHTTAASKRERMYVQTNGVVDIHQIPERKHTSKAI